MRKPQCFLAALALLAGTCCFAQAPQFVEVWTAKIKQDRFAEFGSLATRIADANRRGKGDTFVAYMDFYGPDGQVSIASTRATADEIEPAMNKFLGSVKEYLGLSPDRFMAEVAKTVEYGRSELRRRRPDLSVNVPDPDAWMGALSQARFLYTIALRVKPGRQPEVEKQLLMLKQAAESGDSMKHPVGISQLMAGMPGSVFFVTIPLKGVGEISSIPTVRSILGDNYERYSQMSAENFENLEYRVLRAVPEWSNPPKAYLDANAKFWSARPAPSATPKPKTPPAAEPAKPGKTGGMH